MHGYYGADTLDRMDEPFRHESQLFIYRCGFDEEEPIDQDKAYMELRDIVVEAEKTLGQRARRTLQ